MVQVSEFIFVVKSHDFFGDPDSGWFVEGCWFPALPEEGVPDSAGFRVEVCDDFNTRFTIIQA